MISFIFLKMFEEIDLNLMVYNGHVITLYLVFTLKYCISDA